jgi:hypothetical protein
MVKCTYCKTEGTYKFVRGEGYLCDKCYEEATRGWQTCNMCREKMSSGVLHPGLGWTCGGCVRTPHFMAKSERVQGQINYIGDAE